jgi:transposase-like protein
VLTEGWGDGHLLDLHLPAATRDGLDRRGRQRFACRPCHRDFTHAASTAFSGVRKVHQRRRTSSPPPLQERHPQTIATLIVSIPTVPTQITAACPVFP